MESPPTDDARPAPPIELPRRFNAAHDLIEPNLRAGRGGKVVFRDDTGALTYQQLDERVKRFGSGLLALGLRPEERVLLVLHDTVDFPTAFLGAIRAGLVPIPVNTLLTPADYGYMLADSRARALVVSEPLRPQLESILGELPLLQRVIVTGSSFAQVLGAGAAGLPLPETTPDDPCFWLYSSGSTGRPKGTVHAHASMRETAERYGRGVLGLDESDRVFSAAKLFFAYGLGNALSFVLAAGASALLMAGRPTPESVFERLRPRAGGGPTVFFGVPTLYAAMLADAGFPHRSELSLRLCVSAGEALPAEIGRRFRDRTGVDVLDGIGSTEMLHIFLTNRPDDVRYGTTGKPVPGYALRLVDEHGRPVPAGELGELEISGPSSAMYYWNNRARSRATFAGEWTRSGDKYRQDPGGYFLYCGRTDDMLKVSGNWVSPTEVEAALIEHPAVLEAAVVGWEDERGLVKPKAYVVLRPGSRAGEPELQAHVKERLAPYKYPRWIELVDELPKTATGKIQRFRLRR